MEEFTSNQTAFDSFEEEEDVGPCTFSTSNSVNILFGLYIDSIICILGFVGNIIIIITLAHSYRYKNDKSKQNKTFEVLQLNLAISNLLFVMALPFLIYNELFAWPMGPVACKLLQGSYSINLYSGMLLIAGVSIVHFLAVYRAESLDKLEPSIKLSIIRCVFIWILSILVSIPTFYYYHWYDPTSDDIVMVDSEDENETAASPEYICEFHFEDSESSRMVRVAVPSVQIAVGFFLPLVIIISCYTSLIIKLRNSQMESKGQNGQRNLATVKEPAAIKRGIVIMLVFVVCHMPYNILLLYDTANMFQPVPCEAADGLQAALSVAQTIAYLQCSLNPLVFGFLGETFREKLKKVFSSPSRKTSAHPVRAGSYSGPPHSGTSPEHPTRKGSRRDPNPTEPLLEKGRNIPPQRQLPSIGNLQQ